MTLGLGFENQDSGLENPQELVATVVGSSLLISPEKVFTHISTVSIF